MGKTVLETVRAARELFAEASDVLGYDLADVCLRGPAEKLNSTVVSQPAIFVGSLAALEVLKATDPRAVSDCSATAGLSLGEYTALVFAGAVGFRDGLKLVQRRGVAMQAAADATPSGMLSVLGLDRTEVDELVATASKEGFVQVANLLCPGNIALSGTKAGCAAARRIAEEKGGRTVALAVAGAFHTPIMKPADEALAAALEPIDLRAPRVAVWSNVDAKPHTDPAQIRGLLVRQVLQPVLWEDTLRGLLAEGIDVYYEVGPGRVVAGLMKRVQRKTDFRNCPF
jgi:[acyl-carrier-protein] S-malonyltransferase